MRNCATILGLLVFLVAACGGEPETAGEDGGEDHTMRLTSPAFANGRPIPAKYTADGDDVSPPLAIEGIPEGAKELALLSDDPDAPTPKPWVHWVVSGIAPGTAELPEDWNPSDDGATEGRNSWPEGRNLGWGGPAPPPGTGTHRYVFTLYALDEPLDLEPGATKEDLLAAMKGRVLAEASLTGTYSRD